MARRAVKCAAERMNRTVATCACGLTNRLTGHKVFFGVLDSHRGNVISKRDTRARVKLTTQMGRMNTKVVGNGLEGDLLIPVCAHVLNRSSDER